MSLSLGYVAQVKDHREKRRHVLLLPTPCALLTALNCLLGILEMTTAGERSLETTALVERARFELWWGRTWRCLPEPLKVSTTPRQLGQLGIASKWFEDHMPTGKSPIIEEAGHKPIP